MSLERIEGWESRLAAVVADAALKPYALGEHDCFRVACCAVEALTGADLWAEWAGRYATHTQALRIIAEYGGDFTGSFTKLFGIEPVSVKLARRGDIMEFLTTDGQQHLGVCLCEMVIVLGERGLFYVRITECKHCWRIV